MDNKTYQSFWKKVIIDDEGVKNNPIGIDSDILGMYKEFVWNHYDGALEKMFPRLSDIWDIDWAEISSKYFSKFPPLSWELNDLAKNFPEFLSRNMDNLTVPKYYSDLARYELAEFFVYKSELDASDKGPRLNPTLDIIQSEFDIASWVYQMDELESNGQAFTETVPEQKMSVLFVVQNPETKLCVFTSASLLTISIYEVLNQVDIPRIKFNSEVYQALTHLLPEQILSTLSQDLVDREINFLCEQCVILL